MYSGKDFLKNYTSPEGLPGAKVMSILLRCVALLMRYCYAKEVTFRHLDNGHMAVVVDGQPFVTAERSPLSGIPMPVGHA